MTVEEKTAALTNSIMMKIEAEFRKEGMAASTHRHYEGNRNVIRGIVAIMVAEEMGKADDIAGT